MCDYPSHTVNNTSLHTGIGFYSIFFTSLVQIYLSDIQQILMINCSEEIYLLLFCMQLVQFILRIRKQLLVWLAALVKAYMKPPLGGSLQGHQFTCSS